MSSVNLDISLHC